MKKITAIILAVVIWCTINMEDRAETDGWYRETAPTWNGVPMTMELC